MNGYLAIKYKTAENFIASLSNENKEALGDVIEDVAYEIERNLKKAHEDGLLYSDKQLDANEKMSQYLSGGSFTDLVPAISSKCRELWEDYTVLDTGWRDATQVTDFLSDAICEHLTDKFHSDPIIEW